MANDTSDPSKGGRPQKVINQDEFEKLCALFCTLEEIAGFFSCSTDTIERWCERKYEMAFADIYKQKSANGLISLRRLQYQSAAGGSVAMQIWLGKQKLGQSDQSNISGEGFRPIILKYNLDEMEPTKDEVVSPPPETPEEQKS